MTPLPLSGRLALLLAYIAFACTSGFTPPSVALLLGAAASIPVNGRLPVPRLLMLPIALVLGLVLFTNLPQASRNATFLIASGYGVGIFFGILSLLFMLRSGDTGENLAGMFFGMMLMLIAGATTELMPFAALLAVQGLLLAICLRDFEPPLARRRLRARETPRAVTPELKWAIGAYIAVAALASMVALGLHASERVFNSLLLLADPRSYGYPSRSSLHEINDMRDNPRVLARITSKQAASYLVGRCYVKYERGSWDALVPQQVADATQVPEQQAIFPAGLVFPVASPVPPTYQSPLVDRVETAVEFRGTMFVPRDGDLLGLRTMALYRDDAGVLYLPENYAYQGEYVVTRTPGKLDTTPPSAAFREACLQISPLVLETVDPFAQEACRGAQTDFLKAQAIESYLQTHYTYGRGNKLPAGEPLHGFLVARIPAHCELFATSMVMMLRARHIPARYITGFLVQERNESGDYWVVREQEAHAWVEAYIEGRGWMSFDPTPPDGRPNPSQMSRWQQWYDLLMHRFERIREWVKNISWRSLLSSVLNLAQAVGRWLIEQPWRIAVLVLLFLGEALFRRKDAPGRLWWRRFRARRGGGDALSDPHLDRLLSSMRRFDAWLVRAGMERPPALTLHEYGRSLHERALDAERMDLLQRFIAAYSEARYGMHRPSDELLEKLDGICANLEEKEEAARRRR